MPPRRPPLALAMVLAAAIAALAILADRQYVFQTALHETGDAAANSLAVLRAEHGAESMGAYSRWEFHHPGPTLFYTLALGETICHRVLHLTPAAFNAQVPTIITLLASFFARAIGIAAHWMRSPFFLPLAVLHFGAVDGRFVLFSVWTAYVIPTSCTRTRTCTRSSRGESVFA